MNATQIKNAKISEAILFLVQGGMKINEAIDAVLGSGTYYKMACDLYDELNAQKS
jgi:hypothetical protein